MKADHPSTAKRSYRYTKTGNVVEATPEVLNRSPRAVTDGYRVGTNSSEVFDPRNNDSDPDGDALTITWVGNVQSRSAGGGNGAVAGIARASDGRAISIVGYQPGTATFDYVISDSRYGEASARSRVEVVGGGPVTCGNTFCDPRFNDQADTRGVNSEGSGGEERGGGEGE